MAFTKREQEEIMMLILKNQEADMKLAYLKKQHDSTLKNMRKMIIAMSECDRKTRKARKTLKLHSFKRKVKV